MADIAGPKYFKTEAAVESEAAVSKPSPAITEVVVREEVVLVVASIVLVVTEVILEIYSTVLAVFPTLVKVFTPSATFDLANKSTVIFV